MVPFGDPVLLSEGGLVFVVGTLSSSVTVRTEVGHALEVRVDAADVDALGLDATLNDTVRRGGPFGIDQVSPRSTRSSTPEIPCRSSISGSSHCDEVVWPRRLPPRRHDLTMTHTPGVASTVSLQREQDDPRRAQRRHHRRPPGDVDPAVDSIE